MRLSGEQSQLSIQHLDHVNLRTRDLAGMRRFYADALGLSVRRRDSRAAPGLAFGVDEAMLLHVIESAEVDRTPQPQIEHFAFTGTGLRGLMTRLDAAGVAYNLSLSQDEAVVRVNLRDPDDNRLHVDFPIAEWQVGMAPLRTSTR